MVMRYEVLNTETLYRGFFTMNRLELRFAHFNGQMSAPIQRELFERGHAVAVLPLHIESGQVVLTEQFRPGALEAPGGPWLTEIVAGMIEPDESVEAVAARELQEEAGLMGVRLIPITRYWVSPGGTTESIFLFLGLIDALPERTVHGLPEEQEDIRLRILPFDAALALVDQGAICSAAPIIALQWLDRHRARWQI
ncbi:NUDIX domain-containing protein [Halothiobacillus sp. DCM-1]|uniref:NUDIX domain-containing protein n=1 Tax=Halothiobacillus sp. DCM-1 TaxID=3112558 RepID=UPI003251910F